MLKQLVWLVVLLPGLLLAGQPAVAQDAGCASAFDDVRSFTADVFEAATANIEDGVIAWESTDWENIVRRVVGTSEFYLNNCTDPDLPLSEQAETVEEFAALSKIESPVATLDVGGDFGEVELSSDFAPTTEFIDLNGDGTDELILHTQVPYFSHATVYQIRGGLSIAFFDSEDGWQGQVIAPITEFVTDEGGDHVSFAMVDDTSLIVNEPHEALVYLPEARVEVFPVEDEDGPLTAVALRLPTGTGEAQELNMLIWDGRIPSVELRIEINDWCYPGQPLNWEIEADGSVFVPGNGGEEGSPLHCGRIPDLVFDWHEGRYIAPVIS